MKQRSGAFSYFSGMLMGLIVGIMIWNMLLAGKIDALYTRNLYLETSLEDCKIKLEKAKNAQPEKEQTLREITVKLQLENELERMILEKAVRQKYEVLIGKKTKEIDLDLVIQVVDKRLFRTDKYQYQLLVDRVSLSSTLTLWLSVKEIRPNELE